MSLFCGQTEHRLLGKSARCRKRVLALAAGVADAATLGIFSAAGLSKCRDRITLDVTIEKMSGLLGSLLLLWSAIERSARNEVAQVYDGSLPKSAHGIAAVLDTWEKTVIARQPAASLGPLLASALRAQIQEPLNIRNGVCHGLVGISSAYSETPATLTWEINGIVRSITWSDLQASFRWLSKVPFAISMISNSSSESVGSRIADNSENREWWLEEYGLNLIKPDLSASYSQ